MIHFKGIHVLITLCHQWHTEFNSKANNLTAEAKQASLGIIRGANLQRRCRVLPSAKKTMQSFLLERLLLQQLQFLVGSFPSSSRGERSQETLSWLSWLGLSCRWSSQNLILASITGNELIHQHRLYAFLLSPILTNIRGFFYEPWRHSCLEEIAVGKCGFSYFRQRNKKFWSINSPAFSGPENNSNIEQLGLKTKSF